LVQHEIQIQPYVQKEEVFIVEADGINSYHSAIKG